MYVDIGLDKFIVDLEDFQPVNVFPRRIFHYFIEDWGLPLLEKTMVRKKQNF